MWMYRKVHEVIMKQEVSYKNSLLTNDDLKLLDEGKWLNDKLIGFAFEYIEDAYPKCLLVSPEATQLLNLGSPEDASSVLSSLNAGEKDLILFPLNDCITPTEIGGSHWSLLVFDVKAGQCFHLDSSLDFNFQTAARFCKKLSLPFISPSNVKSINCVQQKNGYDCGIHVICNANHILDNYSKGVPLFETLGDVTSYKHKRKEMKTAILKLLSN
ncbi:sentrin-specific protease 8-like isoform X2 [Artemia franciscana]|uniref:sentrin-specific protease 8-like isoform X2 n=1 Tax=Artemia franciscana TaxID=6661 RepID=UPI0032DBD585